MTSFYQIAFYPHPANRAFNDGYGLSVEYRHLDAISFAANYRLLMLHFSFCEIVLKGDNLRALFEALSQHEAGKIKQADASDPESDAPAFQVAAMTHSFS